MASTSFLFKTALKDSRKNRGKLLLFMSSIVLGIAALVAINSFNYNLVEDIDEESKSLLGADMVISGNRAATESLQSTMDSIPGNTATEVEMFSMAYFPKQAESQFVRINAIDGGFPFYGQLQTQPKDATDRYKHEKIAILDDGIMLQYGIEVGDSIRLGQTSFVIEGRLMTDFGSISMGSTFAPSVYIGLQYMKETELIQPGSFVDYSYYYKVAEDFDPDVWEDKAGKDFRDNGLRIETISEQRENLEEAFSSLNNFLNLVALVSLLLACIGVASSVMIYVKNKINSIAILRCLGMKGNEAFLIYFLQIIGVGLLSVIVGAFVGSGIQLLLPIVLRDLLPYEVDMGISWRAILEGVSVGMIITSLFALIPLVAIRNISPLRTLRSIGDETSDNRDPWKWIIYFSILISVFLFLWRLTGYVQDASVFTIGLLAAFLILYGVARLITWTIRRFFPKSWSYVFRQGLSNLYRPNNQTNTLIVSIGLGTAILTTLFIIQGLILKNVESMGAGNQPNMILFGIERMQVEELAAITRDYDMPVIQKVPVVTMDLVGWKGRTKKEWMDDSTRTVRHWAVNREARVSFQDTLSTDEELIEGTFTGVVKNPDSIFISLGERYADAMDVSMGDEMVWNVQGALITTYVGSIRKLDFTKMESRFFILFPTGVLENAPQFNILVTKSPDKNTTAQYRNEVVRNFPNVSVIDLGSILKTLNDILTKVSYVIKFMAAFSILIGLIVLISSLFLSKFQRIKEAVLLRTIGATKSQILKINFVEYAMIGTLSSATGIVISLISSFLLTKFVFDLEFRIEWWPILLIFFFITFLTIIVGFWNSREVINKSPLEILRREG